MFIQLNFALGRVPEIMYKILSKKKKKVGTMGLNLEIAVVSDRAEGSRSQI